MPILGTIVVVVLFLASSSVAAGEYDTGYLRKVCRATRHPTLCMHSLSPYSGPEMQSPRGWARAAVSVTLNETERLTSYMTRISGGRVTGLAKVALSDCVECLSDAVAQLHSSLSELRQLDKSKFEQQMSDVETWVSAALTNQNTCLDGLRGCGGPEVEAVRKKVVNATFFTSNALALVNTLAASGGN